MECPVCGIDVDEKTWSAGEKEVEQHGGVNGKSGEHVTMTEELVVQKVELVKRPMVGAWTGE